jgi:hypothetical protein
MFEEQKIYDSAHNSTEQTILCNHTNLALARSIFQYPYVSRNAIIQFRPKFNMTDGF